MAGQLDAAGADALVLFNRFYQPDFDIETRTVVPSLALARPTRSGCRCCGSRCCTAACRPRWRRPPACTGAVEAIKYLMAGADVVMSTSALLQQGPPFLARLLAEVTDWMERKGYTSVSQMRGSMSQQSIPDSTRVRARQLHQGPRELHEDDGQHPPRGTIEAGAEVTAKPHRKGMRARGAAAQSTRNRRRRFMARQ